MGMPASQQPAAPPRRWTVEEVRALQDEERAWPRYELIDGELLVSPAPQPLHQRAVRLVSRALDDYVDRHDLGEVLESPADLELEPGTVLQPDVFVVPAGGEPLTTSWHVVRTLLLAVEVVSPGSARSDRVRKRRFYQRVGVPEYWIVDLDARTVERWRPGDERPEVLDAWLEWRPARASEPLVLDVAALFARVHRELPPA